MIYDLIIIGGGPAGSAAAVYAARKRLNTLFITDEFGGQSIVSEKIYNWIGTTEIAGSKLAEDLKNHVLANKGEKLTIKEGLTVVAIVKIVKDGPSQNSQNCEGPSFTSTGIFSIKTESGEEFETKTVLITTGSKRRKLEIKNADKLEHKGLTYCATCDGPMFSGADVVVVGGGNAAFESASQLLAYCNSVTILNRSDSFRADQITIDKLSKNPKLKIIKNIELLEVLGDKFVEGIKYKDINTNKENTLNITGIFVEIGQIPNTEFAKDLISLDKIGKIKIDPWTGKTETSGIWAAGDCTNILYHQNNIAAGDAVKALEDIYLTIHTK
ncbi:MAG: FAD-dependent oxidoreductase [bacterium]